MGPLVRAAPPTVTGSIAADVIRRVILRNLGIMSHCFETGLARNPNLSGRIVIRFVVGSGGAVLASAVNQSTVADPAVSACVAQAVSRLQFPSVPSGNVVVLYPFNFRHAD
jgi:hypothetical protein